MIHILVSLGNIVFTFGIMTLGFLGFVASSAVSLLTSLFAVPVILLALLSVIPAMGLGFVMGFIEEHPEVLAIGALCLGVVLALYIFLRNGVNRKNNRINGAFNSNNTPINSKVNGISKKDMNKNNKKL